MVGKEPTGRRNSEPGRVRGANFIRFACLTLLVLFPALRILAAQGPLQFDVFVGYDGLVPEASWFPVLCEVKNDGPTFRAVIEVTPGNYNQGQTRRALVELPTGTLKRVVVPVFANRGDTAWDVRLLDERGKARAEQIGVRARKQISAGHPVFGAITRQAGGTPVLRPVAAQETDTQTATARLLPQILPDNPLVLEGMDTLYLSSEKAPELRAPNQVEAIYAWVNAGGHLIVGVEQVTDINSTPWLKELFPVTLKDMRPLKSHAELQEWLSNANWPTTPVASQNMPRMPQYRRSRNYKPPPAPSDSSNATTTTTVTEVHPDATFEGAEIQVATGSIKEGRALVSVDGTPLIVTAPRGRGKVTALLFSPEREPFRSWRNLPIFWAWLVGMPANGYGAADYNYNGGMSTDGIFGAMLDTKQVHKLPVEWLLLLLLVYLVVIGPLDQYWLKKIGKPMLTWVTFPCYVIFFSLLIYFIGYRLRAGESEWNQLDLVDVLMNGDRAEMRGHSYVSVYAPANERYQLESPEKYATFRGEFVGGWGRGSDASEKATVIQTGDSFKAEIFVPVWTSQLFVSDWWQGTDAPLNVTVTPKSDGWQVQVENLLEQKVNNLAIAIEGEIIQLGELAGKQNKTLNIRRGQGVSIADFVSTHGGNFANAVAGRQQAFGARESGRLSDVPNGTLATSFISKLNREHNNNNYGYMGQFIAVPGLDVSSTLDAGRAVVFAYADDYSPVPSLYKAAFKRAHKHTMFRLPVSIQGTDVKTAEKS